MSAFAAFLLSLLGFACLCASLTRHERELFGRTLARREKRALRLAGFGVLAAALGASLLGHGFGYGATLWCGVMSIAAGIVVAALTLRASRADAARRR